MPATGPDRVPSRWIHASRIGLAAWIVGNTYEGIVGVPQLLADARPTRKPGVLSMGSPVRFYAAVAPLVFVATGFSLIASWRVVAQRRSVVVAGAGLAEALAISAYLIPVVNKPLLTGTSRLSATTRRKAVRAWQFLNSLRLVGLVVGFGAVTRLLAQPDISRNAPE